MKKGFTLVELLAVIVILGIILIITVPNVIGILNESKNNLNKNQKEAIVEAARAWGTKNLVITSIDEGAKKFVPVSDLQSQGYLDNQEITNLLNKNNNCGENNNECGVCIKHESNKNFFTYEYWDNSSEGDCES